MRCFGSLSARSSQDFFNGEEPIRFRSSAGLWSALYFKRALIALPCRWVTTFKHDVTGLFGYRHRSFIVLAVRALESA